MDEDLFKAQDGIRDRAFGKFSAQLRQKQQSLFIRIQNYLKDFKTSGSGNGQTFENSARNIELALDTARQINQYLKDVGYFTSVDTFAEGV